MPTPRGFRALAIYCLAGGLLVAASNPDPSGLAREAQSLYRNGQLGDALLKFEEAIKAGASGGELFYQAGYCYKAVRQDAERSREYMTKAIPLLEAAGTGSLAPLYYLSVIQSLELGESTKGQEVARRAVALVEQGTFAAQTDGESCFQIGHLYSLAGEAAKAIPWYEKAVAALEPAGEVNRQHLTHALDRIVQQAVMASDWARAADAYARLQPLDPANDRLRLSAGSMMVRAGRYKDAASTLRSGFTDDDLATEANYSVRVLTRFEELGSPPSPPDVAKLEDARLGESILASARKLGEIRQKEEEPPQTPPERPHRIVKMKDGTEVKVYKPLLVPPPEDWQPEDPNRPTPEEARRLLGFPPQPKRTAPPPSAERLAAEREFFSLLVEVLRRGRSVREMSFAGGYASFIFR